MLAACAAAVTQGRPWVVWIEGAAGTGKTALLRQAVAALPAGFRVLRAEASEVAADVAFDVISQLGTVTRTAPFPVAMELLGLWSAEGSDPMAVVVEDLHWADAESRLALLTAVRRLRQDRVLVLVTSRPEPGHADGWDRLRADPDRCLPMAVGPLSPAEVAALAAQRGLLLSDAAVRRLVSHTGGHPMHVRILLAEISPAMLADGEGELPVPRSLTGAMLARMTQLTPPARRLGAALAVLNQPAPLQLLSRVAGVEGAARATDSLLATEAVIWRAGETATLEFAHPLYRSAVYAGMRPSLRQELHRRASTVTGGAAALGHRVAAADSADDDLAEELELAARAETTDGRLGRAATCLLWASQLSSSWQQAERRLLRAARLRLAAGQSPQAESLRSRLEACGPQPLRSLVLGMLAWEQGDAVTAERQLREAAAGPAGDGSAGDGSADGVTADALARLAVLYATQIRGREGVDAATRALALPGVPAEVDGTASLALAFSEGVLHGAATGLERLARRLPQRAAEVGPADVDVLIARGSLRMHAGHPHAAVADLRAGVRLARYGPSQLLTRAHLDLCQALFLTGNWDEALVHGRVALSLISDERHSWIEGLVHAALVYVLGSRGDTDRAREHQAAAKRLIDGAGTTREGLLVNSVAEALVGLAQGEPEAVISALDWLADLEDKGRTMISMLEWWPILVMALLATGALDDAARQIDALTAAAAQRRLNLDARIRGLRARLLARTGQPDEATTAFAAAVAMLGRDDPFLDTALLHHDYGSFLLARGSRKEGLTQLRKARKMLADVGATPYLRRLDTDLAPAGIRSSRPATGVGTELTDREADVVALVSKGMTNAEIAAELYVSVNTVEFHLRRIFAKLGVTSRRQLRRRPD